MIDSIIDSFNQGKLQAALSEANDLVANKPRALEPRILLAQLICFTGNWERAGKIIGQLKTLDSNAEHVALTNLLDALVSGETQRSLVWNEGAVPEFAEPANETTKKLLWAWNCRRSQQIVEYQQSMESVVESAAVVTLKTGEVEAAGLRDLDDMTCSVLEAHSIYGSYYWLPLSTISRIEVSKPTRPMDFLWNSARLKFHNESEARMYLCGTYFRSFASGEDRFLLGRESEWKTGEDSLDVGLGRKLFVAGDEEFTLLEFADIEFTVED